MEHKQDYSVTSVKDVKVCFITECLKMTTFKIVFTLDGFLSAETTMHCKVTCILYKKQAHFSQLFCLQVPRYI
jgi:hypothetical protein